MSNFNKSPWLWSTLMPHPPVLIPEVGHGAEKNAGATLDGLEQLTRAVHDLVPDVLFVLSPHLPYAPGALRINSSAQPSGSFALFRAGGVTFDLDTDIHAADCLAAYLEERRVHVRMSPAQDLSYDQGSLVPLYFLRREWGKLPKVILASPIGLTPSEAYAMGQILAEFGGDGDKTWALLASGDLSHRLTPSAPAGYEPEAAQKFEEAIDIALRDVDAGPLFGLSGDVIERAGECGLRSVMTMLGLVGALNVGGIKIFSHEGPFGVGYCTALAI